MRLIRRDFRAWLERKPGEEVVGVARECGDCPLARYLVSEGYSAPVIHYSYAYATSPAGRDVYLQWPPWAESFISGLDGAELGAPITAAHALELLG